MGREGGTLWGTEYSHWGSAVSEMSPQLQVPVPTVPQWVSPGTPRVPSRHRRAAQPLSCGGRAAASPGLGFSGVGARPGPLSQSQPLPRQRAGAVRARLRHCIAVLLRLRCLPGLFFFFFHSFCNFLPSSLQVAAAAGEEPRAGGAGVKGARPPQPPPHPRTPLGCPCRGLAAVLQVSSLFCLVWTCSPPTPTAPVPSCQDRRLGT